MNEAHARVLADAVARDFPRPGPLRHAIWTAPPALKIIDCVFSLNRRYDEFVVPRVAAFAERYPEARSAADLVDLIEAAPSPAVFTAEVLRVRDFSRARTLLGVARYAADAGAQCEGATEDERLGRWARWARPGDFLAVGVPGFGLAGFQYLRMLFGAETAKPDVHVVRYVADAIKHRVTEARALYLLERAAELAGVPLRPLDVAIWEAGAKAAAARGATG
ncbi:MAG: hypothetical protein ACKVU4_00360 [Phycisphaerales bacterium]